MALGASPAQADAVFPGIVALSAKEQHAKKEKKDQSVKENKQDETATDILASPAAGDVRKEKKVVVPELSRLQMNAKLRHFVSQGKVFGDLFPEAQATVTKALAINIPRISDSKELVDLLQT